MRFYPIAFGIICVIPIVLFGTTFALLQLFDVSDARALAVQVAALGTLPASALPLLKEYLEREEGRRNLAAGETEGHLRLPHVSDRVATNGRVRLSCPLGLSGCELWGRRNIGGRNGPSRIQCTIVNSANIGDNRVFGGVFYRPMGRDTMFAARRRRDIVDSLSFCCRPDRNRYATHAERGLCESFWS
jgi:hypothetical protein